MKKTSNILAAVCLILLAFGFSGLGPGVFAGFCRALGAVFFILAFVTRVIEKAESEA
jgi:hypothetical protein